MTSATDQIKFGQYNDRGMSETTDMLIYPFGMLATGLCPSPSYKRAVLGGKTSCHPSSDKMAFKHL